MNIEFKIDENAFLVHQLYTASNSDHIKKKRQKSKVIVPLIYLALGIVFYIQSNIALSILFIVIGILWFFLFPMWEKYRYVKHYREFIKENYRDRLNKTSILEINNENIIAKDDGTESKVQTKEINEIIEIAECIFIKLKTGQSFILPKDKIDNIDELITRLKELAQHLNINYNIDNTWEWK